MNIEEYIKKHGSCNCFLCKALRANPKEIEDTLFCNVCHQRKHLDHFQESQEFFICKNCCEKKEK